jgi:Uma2 family endonuclease
VIEVAMTGTEEPRLIRWTREEYYRLADAGLFEGRHVELIKGQIFEVGPPSAREATAVTLGAATLRPIFESSGFSVRVRCPLEPGDESAPEPDMAVVTGEQLDYLEAHPTTAALIVEVADTSLEMDRGRKASLYAGAGIADYWILNLVGRQLEVYRDPAPDPDQTYGYGYVSVTIHTHGDVVSPLAAPAAAVAVADLLP